MNANIVTTYIVEWGFWIALNPDDLGEIFQIQKCLQTQSVEDDFALLGHFDPGGRHQQVEVLRKDVLPKYIGVGPPDVALLVM